MALPAFDEVFKQNSILPPSVQLSDFLDAARTVQEIDQQLVVAKAELMLWAEKLQASMEHFHRIIVDTGTADHEPSRLEWQAKLQDALPQFERMADEWRVPFTQQRQFQRMLRSLRGNPAALRAYALRLGKLEELRVIYVEAFDRLRLEVVALIAELDPDSRPHGTVISSADELTAYLDRLH